MNLKNKIYEVAEKIDRWVFTHDHLERIIERYSKEKSSRTSSEKTIEKLIYEEALYKTIEVGVVFKGGARIHNYLMAYPHPEGESIPDTDIFFYLDTANVEEEIQDYLSNDGESEWYVVSWGEEI